MSTKCTITYGDEFHLYQEVLDNDHVYFEMNGNRVDFEASPGRVLVTIPIEIWEAIRQTSPADYEWADKTDEEIRADAERTAIEMIEQYKQDEDRLAGLVDATGKPRRPFSALFGANKPYETQVADYIAAGEGRRTRARDLRAKVATIVAQGLRHKRDRPATTNSPPIEPTSPS